MQYHFVGLDVVKTTVATETTSALPVQGVSIDKECDGIDDETIAAGDQHRIEITGGTHASMMSLENPEQIVSIALKDRNHCLLCLILTLS